MSKDHIKIFLPGYTTGMMRDRMDEKWKQLAEKIKQNQVSIPPVTPGSPEWSAHLNAALQAQQAQRDQ